MDYRQNRDDKEELRYKYAEYVDDCAKTDREAMSFDHFVERYEELLTTC